MVLFSSVAPDNFAAFDRAFLTLFYITGGNSWPDALPKFNEDGTANWVVAAYIMGYTMVELWVILQVDPPSCRQWPEVYELCHTFLHVVRVKKSTAMRESHAGMRIARATCKNVSVSDLSSQKDALAEGRDTFHACLAGF